MAVEIDATYRQIEKRLGVDFTAQLHRTLDYVLERLPEPENESTPLARSR